MGHECLLLSHETDLSQYNTKGEIQWQKAITDAAFRQKQKTV